MAAPALLESEVQVMAETKQAAPKAAPKQAAKKAVNVECVQVYKDVELDRIVRTGEQYEVTPERAAKLLEANLVKRV